MPIDIQKGTLIINYEFQVEDEQDPMSSTYLGVLSVETGAGDKIELRHADERMLEEVLIKIYHNCTVK